MVWEHPVARAIVFFLVPVVVATGLGTALDSDPLQGLLVGVAVGIPFAIYGAFFVTPASDGE